MTQCPKLECDPLGQQPIERHGDDAPLVEPLGAATPPRMTRIACRAQAIRAHLPLAQRRFDVRGQNQGARRLVVSSRAPTSNVPMSSRRHDAPAFVRTLGRFVTSLRRSETALTIALVALTSVAAFGPSALGRIVAFRDTLCFTYPGRLLVREAARAGSILAWNPYVEMGVPALAAPHHGPLYLGNLLLVLGPADVGFGLTWLAHALWTALGGFVLGRVFGLRPLAAGVPALVLLAGGYAVSMWSDGDKVLSLAEVPWIAAALVHWGRAPRRLDRGVLLSLALAATAAAGDPFVWLDALALAIVVAVAAESSPDAAPLPAREHARRAAGHVARGVGASVLAMLLAAPVLLPSWLLRPETERAGGLARAVAERWSLHPLRLVELVAPFALGDPMNLERYPGAELADDPTVQALPYALSLYPGALVVAAAFAASPKRRTAVMSTGAVFALLVSFGRHTPVHALLARIVPPLAWMRYPEKHALVALALLALLAGEGVERILAGRVRLRGPAIAFVLLGAIAAAVVPPPMRSHTLHGLAISGVALSAALVALSAARRWHRLAPVALAVLAVDLVVHARPLLPWAPAEALVARGRPTAAAAAAGAPRGPAPPRLFRYDRDPESAPSLPDGLASLYGIGEAPGHDPAKSRRVAALRRELPLPLYLQALGTQALLLPPDISAPAQPSFVAADDWRLVPMPPAPRAWLTGNVVVLRDEDVPGAIARRELRLFDQVALGSRPAAPIDPSARAACEVVSFERERVEVGCPPTRGAVLVLAESYAPGWTATVDGQPSEVIAADLAHRAVVLPPGARRIVFTYACPGLVEGTLIAIATALFAVLLVVRARRGEAKASAELHRDDRN
jgi:hypothetical protein